MATKTQSLQLEMLILSMYSTPDTVCRWVFIVYDCPSMQLYGPPETMLAVTYVQRYCTKIGVASPAPLRGLDATRHIGAHVGKPETAVQCTCSQREENPPERIKGILSFCQNKLGSWRIGINIMEVRMLLSIGLKSKRAGSGLLVLFSV